MAVLMKIANKLFDGFPKDTPESWRDAVHTIAYTLAMIFSAGSKEKGTKFEMTVAFPDAPNRASKGYKVIVMEIDEKELEVIQDGPNP